MEVVVAIAGGEHARRLVLVASAKPWNTMRAVEELGDALYSLDPAVDISVDPRFPLLYVFSARLTWRRAFSVIVREPPAYIERVVPVTSLYSGRVVSERDVAALVEFVRGILAGLGFDSGTVSVEARVRGYYVEGFSSKEFTGLISRLIGRLGFRVYRKAAIAVRVEDTLHGIVVGVIEGSDRLSFWRRQRLGLPG